MDCGRFSSRRTKLRCRAIGVADDGDASWTAATRCTRQRHSAAEYHSTTACSTTRPPAQLLQSKAPLLSAAPRLKRKSPSRNKSRTTCIRLQRRSRRRHAASATALHAPQRRRRAQRVLALSNLALSSPRANSTSRRQAAPTHRATTGILAFVRDAKVAAPPPMDTNGLRVFGVEVRASANGAAAPARPAARRTARARATAAARRRQCHRPGRSSCSRSRRRARRRVLCWIDPQEEAQLNALHERLLTMASSTGCRCGARAARAAYLFSHASSHAPSSACVLRRRAARGRQVRARCAR